MKQQMIMVENPHVQNLNALLINVKYKIQIILNRQPGSETDLTEKISFDEHITHQDNVSTLDKWLSYLDVMINQSNVKHKTRPQYFPNDDKTVNKLLEWQSRLQHEIEQYK